MHRIGVAWIKPQPLKTFTQPVQCSTKQISSREQTFIQCTHAPFFSEAGERAKRQGFRYRELFSAGHDAMITMPRQLADVLIELVER
jgi:hypothetical protein